MSTAPPPLTDQQLRDAVIAAITEDGLKPRDARQGLVDAMLAVVRPELDRLRAERDQARAELVTARADAFREAARVLEHTGRDDDAVNLLDNVAHGITTHAAAGES